MKEESTALTGSNGAYKVKLAAAEEQNKEHVEALATKIATIETAKNDIRLLDQRLDLEEKASSETGKKLRVALARCNTLNADLSQSQGETASLLAIATTAALSTAQSTARVHQLRNSVHEIVATAKSLAQKTAVTRRALLERARGESDLGIVLASADGKRGARVISIKPGSVADKCTDVRLGDVIVQVNDTVALSLSSSEVDALFAETADMMCVTIELAAADQVDEDGSLFDNNYPESANKAPEPKENVVMVHCDVPVVEKTNSDRLSLTETVMDTIEARLTTLFGTIDAAEGDVALLTAELAGAGERIASGGATTRASQSKASVSYVEYLNSQQKNRDLNSEIETLMVKYNSRKSELAASLADFETLSSRVSDMGGRLTQTETSSTTQQLDIERLENALAAETEVSHIS